MGSFIRIGLGIEEGESSLCGGAPRAVIPDGILKCRDPACMHPKTYHRGFERKGGGKKGYFPLSRKFIYSRIYRRAFRPNFIKHRRRDLQIG